MPTPLEMQRTFAIVGTGGCGKTSLAEMLLYKAGAVNRLGAVEDGTTCLDYEPEETRRRGSVQPSCATYLWNKTAISFWISPVTATLQATWMPLKGVDSVVFVLDAVDGVRPLAKKFWNLVRAAGLPSIIVVNKVDRDRADFQMALDGSPPERQARCAAIAYSPGRILCGCCRCADGQGPHVWRKRRSHRG